MPAVLVEVCFLTNQDDFDYITTHQYDAARGIADGTTGYFEDRGLLYTTHSPVDIVAS